MNIYEKMREFNRANKPFVVATVVKTSGSVPGKIGFKIIITGSGETFGTVGGGEIEQRVISESLERLKNDQSGLQEYILQEKDTGQKTSGEAEIVPMMCNGRTWIYYDVVGNRTPVYLFGGGHVGKALSQFLSALNYHLILVDNRKEFLEDDVNPHVNERILSEYPEFAQKFEPPGKAFVVVMTQGHGFDYEVIKAIYQRNLGVRYVGVIASKSKSAQLIKKLKDEFGEEVNLSNLFTPIGLRIGGITETEIALSIAAEIQAVRFNENAAHMKIETADN